MNFKRVCPDLGPKQKKRHEESLIDVHLTSIYTPEPSTAAEQSRLTATVGLYHIFMYLLHNSRARMLKKT